MKGLARVRRWLSLFAWGLLLAAGACGCGSKAGTIKGKVTVDGKPAIGATVLFSVAENQSVVASVCDDGSYETNGVPLGPAKVAIRPGRAMPPMGTDSKAAPPPPASIPSRYSGFDTSGLTLTVQSGFNDFNIEMTSKPSPKR